MAATKNVLLLGAGFVSGPVVDYLLRSPGNHITVADLFVDAAVKLAAGRDRVTTCGMDVGDEAGLEKLIAAHDLTISLIPYQFHPLVARICIKNKKNMVTASYLSPELKALDESAHAAGITILNEVGLDPGIDHLSALEIINEVKGKGGKVLSFKSWCGGLPAPECSNNPLGYKFSWSPLGVLKAARNAATYLKNGKTVEIASQDLLRSAEPVNIFRGMAIEGIPNRNSLPYSEEYGIEGAHTVFRGTLRFSGCCELMQAFVDIGLLNDDKQSFLAEGAPAVSWAQLLRQLLKVRDGIQLEDAVLKHLGLDASSDAGRRIIEGLQWFGMLGDLTVNAVGSYILALCKLLESRLSYNEGERDMVLMQHIFDIEYPGGKKEERKSTMLAYGEVGGYTAMSRTVGFPVAITTQMVLDGTINRKGTLRPSDLSNVSDILVCLAKEGIKCEEESVMTAKVDSTNVKRILLLGSGFVCGPVVEYLLRKNSNHVTIASLLVEEAETLAAGRDRTSVVKLNVKDEAGLEQLVAAHDLCISLIPYQFHPIIAKLAIKHKKNMVTASYVSPELKALDESAKEAGVVIMNEMGLDPGIDHLSAMRIINEVKKANGKVVSFTSYCGGLPAPECSDNPIGYKFSWSPQGVLKASQNAATYLENGEVVEVAGSKLLTSNVPVSIYQGMALEGIPNRNSLPYQDEYHLDGVRTMFRGTLRFAGYCEVMQAFMDLGLLSQDAREDLKEGAASVSWSELLRKLLGCEQGASLEAALKKELALDDSPKAKHVLDAFRWFGMLADTPVKACGNLMLSLCALLEERLGYKENERDMVVLQHVFGIEYPCGKKEEQRSTLLAYGDPKGYTAMSRTVGFTAGIAAQMVLDGDVQPRGVLRPMDDPSMANIALDLLAEEGIVCEESTVTL